MSEPSPSSVTWRTGLPATVELVRTLHDLDWGAWSRPDVDRMMAEHADWKIRRIFPDGVVLGMEPRELFEPLGPELYFQTVVPKQPRYRIARLWLLDFTPGGDEEERRAELKRLSEALAAVGTPTPVPTAADGFGLRWQSADRTLLLQTNDRRAWLAVHPVTVAAEHISPELPAVIAAFAPLLHDAPGGVCEHDTVARIAADVPGWTADVTEARTEIRTADPACTPVLLGAGQPAGRYNRLVLHRFDEAPALEHRRDVFGAVYRAVCGVLGEPTLHGGGPDGPDARWREAGESAVRLLRLRADRRSVWLETAPAEEVEEEEYGTFAHGGPSGGADGRSDFHLLPYSWQLHVSGPGDLADRLPGGRLAGTLPHLREGLELLLAAWIEQLPVQCPGEKATFSLADRRISGGLSFAYDQDKGVLLRVGSRPGDPEAVAAAMTADGWQPSGKRWKAEFKTPTQQTAAEVAALITTELAARGITDPQDGLTARRVVIGPAYGFLRVTGLGV
ncbi:hypothetical protein J5Y04_05155 [Kitasatospora sp. RG8]|uniref:hypothetical protein n=1 Tax=Kitasatospora sp. RG8 TaxID=2820815 RepID=UPI001AE09587|nr:hypothetical protein [Kitasatospora sp. RG8]MBP0448931.1 hypothetical protein [Kitasatospora sp. RG8]